MEKETLKYSLTNEVVNFILQALSRVQFNSFESAEWLISLKNILLNPDNKSELEEKTYKELDAKY
jgi:hypothetical protein